MAWNDGLTGAALAIAAATQSPLRVMAGPGTGKSFALKRRVARLLEEGVKPSQILAVTFTRNAARALVNDIRDLNIVGSQQINAGTLHSFCFGLLSRNDVLEISGRATRPLLTFKSSGILRFEAEGLLHDFLYQTSFGPRREITKQILAFEAAWARLQSEVPGWPTTESDRIFQDFLISWLRFHGAMLIGEVVPEALKFLRANPHFNPGFDHVLVDEFQDLNRAEQELIDVLGAAGAISIVGDVDQSIYRFRHANPEGISTYATSHPNTYDQSLQECRRCPKRVVVLANELISKNHGANLAQRLVPRPGNCDGDIAIVQWADLNAEANGLAGLVTHLINSRGVEPGDILVLTPRKLIGYAIRDALNERGIDAHSFYQEEAFESTEAQYALAMLTLLVDKEDRVALRYLLGRGSDTGFAEEYALLRTYCEDNNLSPWQTMVSAEQDSSLLPGVDNLLLQFTEIIAAVEDLGSGEISAIVDELMPAGEEGVSGLRDVALRVLPNCETVEKLYNAICHELAQPEIPEDAEYVRVMSLQKSKGLTAKVTIVTTCNQAFIPIVDGNLPPVERREALQEQRRLFYVAMTRCTDILVLSSISKIERALAHKLGTILPRGGGQYARTPTTQFIGELGSTTPATITGEEWLRHDFPFGN